MVTTVEALITEFGGIKPFAEMVGVSLPPVYRAKDLNRIPHRWKPRVMVECKKRRIKLDPKLLGLEAA